MKFAWDKYKEIKVDRRNTLQVFITNKCNLKCQGCFARNIMENKKDMSIGEYNKVVHDFLYKGGKQINLIGGEPLLHPKLKEFIAINNKNKIKTTIYTNGYLLEYFTPDFFQGAKLRVSIYNYSKGTKSALQLVKSNIPIDICFMVSSKTSVEEMLNSAYYLEDYNCDNFFISSLRELDNPSKEFFDDTEYTMNLIEYKRLVHDFLGLYKGNLDIHISKRGVFESTLSSAENKCIFANYFIGGKIIQCPYDIVNEKYQDDYNFGVRYCQHNNTCLMSKIKLKKK